MEKRSFISHALLYLYITHRCKLLYTLLFFYKLLHLLLHVRLICLELFPVAMILFLFLPHHISNRLFCCWIRILLFVHSLSTSLTLSYLYILYSSLYFSFLIEETHIISNQLYIKSFMFNFTDKKITIVSF